MSTPRAGDGSGGLDLTDVDVAYDGALAVRGVSLGLAEGQVLAVLGPSGSGKSTLLRAVAGLEPVAAGRIRFDGADLAGVPTHRRGFALMFQDGQLFAHLSVARNVGYALRLRRTPARQAAARVEELLALVGLAGYGDRMPATLSGGERQRVALARSLAVDPRLLLLDEPLSALDAGLRERLAGDLARILREAGTTALMVTHDQEEAFAVADRLAVLREGRLVQQGAVADVWSAPADPDTALFLGYARVLDGRAARLVSTAAGMPPAGLLAVRRSALTASPRPSGASTTGASTGAARPPRLTGVVLAARATPEVVRLVVEVDGVGRLDAVAAPGAVVAVGEQVGLDVEASRLAVLPGPAAAEDR